MNKFKEGVYFEKYETAEEAKEELLKLHPIGSDVEELVKTLDTAGAREYNPYDYYETVQSNVKKYKKPSNMVWYEYTHNTLNSIFIKRWNIAIQQDELNNINLLTVQVYQGE